MATHRHKTNQIDASERIYIRVTPQTKELLQRAAALTGQTLTEYLVAHTVAAAARDIQSHAVITLAAQDFDMVMDALAHPPAPTEKLQRAAKRYKQLVTEVFDE